MEITLDDALNELFGQQVAAAPRETTGERIPTPQTGPPDMLLEARDLVEEARQALQAGNFGTFGDRFSALEQLLMQNGTQSDTTAAR
jgi:hypothetical protein